MTTRLSKIVMSLALGLYVGVVAYDNIVDYATNYAFVQHVFSMDTTLPTTALRSRAITAPAIWQATYVLIIAGEIVTALLFGLGALALWRVRAAPAPVFEAGKRWVMMAATLGFLIWFLGFYVVAGEWFASWQAPHWTSEPPAFRPLMVILAVLIFLHQPDADPPVRPK